MSATPPNARFTNPPALPPPNGYTHVVEVTGGRTVYISGQIAMNTDGQVVGAGDMQVQTTQVFTNIQTALEAIGATFDHVVKLTYYLVDITQIAAVREIRNQYINTHQPPASSAVEVRRLIHEDLLIEIDAVAVIPAGMS